MDQRIRECQNITEKDIEFLRRVEAGLAITADVSRADITLCCKLDNKNALIARHMRPQSTSSLYRKNMTGSTLTDEAQPILFRTFKSGNIGRGQKEVLSSGAPVIQDCYPIYSEDRRMIGALVYETNMVAHERHRRRNRHFRQAAQWLQSMCIQRRTVRNRHTEPIWTARRHLSGQSQPQCRLHEWHRRQLVPVRGHRE